MYPHHTPPPPPVASIPVISIYFLGTDVSAVRKQWTTPLKLLPVPDSFVIHSSTLYYQCQICCHLPIANLTLK